MGASRGGAWDSVACITQMNVRVPATLPVSGFADRVRVTVSTAGVESRQGLTK